jgi:hypothetical protein
LICHLLHYFWEHFVFVFLDLLMKALFCVVGVNAHTFLGQDLAGINVFLNTLDLIQNDWSAACKAKPRSFVRPLLAKSARPGRKSPPSFVCERKEDALVTM